jgi:hypothetical protein
MQNLVPSLRYLINQRISQTTTPMVWTPTDFLDLGNRHAIDKTLQRMTNNGDLRRLDRGLYDQPKLNKLTGKITAPDYHAVISAISRRDQIRMLVDGMTAANDLGLTNAVPGQIIVHTDARLSPIHLDNLTIQFKVTTPKKLYWVGHPAMRIVQALYWLRDNIKNTTQPNQHLIKTKLTRLLYHSDQANNLRNDLQSGLHTVPVWMQQWIKELLQPTSKTITT